MPSLPEYLYEDTIGDTIYGSGYTVPWALSTGEDGELYIDGGFALHPTPGGTVTMFVTVNEDGITVDITRCKDYKWHPGGSSYLDEGHMQRVDHLIY